MAERSQTVTQNEALNVVRGARVRRRTIGEMAEPTWINCCVCVILSAEVTKRLSYMAHEDLHREQKVEGSSVRAFGIVFAVVFTLIAAWPLLHGGGLRLWSLAVAIAFAFVAWLRPTLLAGLNRWWLKLGLFLGKVVSPIALGILFYAVLVPIGF